MPQLAIWLLALVTPIVRKVLAALGIGILTYASSQYLVSQLHSAVASAWGGAGGQMAQVLSLAGLPEALGILLGGMSARVTVTSFGKLGRITQ